MTTGIFASNAHSHPLYSSAYSDPNIWFEDDIFPTDNYHSTNSEFLYEDQPPQTTFYWQSRAEEIIAAAEPVSSEEAGGWFAARSTNWLISATRNFESRNLFTAYVHHAIARFFDCFSSSSAADLANILNVEANDVSRLLNRSDWDRSSWDNNADDHLNSLNALKIFDAIFSTSHYELKNTINRIVETEHQRKISYYLLKKSLEANLTFINETSRINPDINLAQSLAEDAEAKMCNIRSEIAALHEISNKIILSHDSSERIKSINKALEDLSINIGKMEHHTDKLLLLIFNMEMEMSASNSEPNLLNL